MPGITGARSRAGFPYLPTPDTGGLRTDPLECPATPSLVIVTRHDATQAKSSQELDSALSLRLRCLPLSGLSLLPNNTRYRNPT